MKQQKEDGAPNVNATDAVSHEIIQRIRDSNIADQISARRQGLRKRVMHGGKLCSRCLVNPRTSKDTYCVPCRREYQFAWNHKRKDAEL